MSFPCLGLVCLTASNEVRFRTITRSRYLQLAKAERREALRSIYWDNLQRLHAALSFCARRGIRLYRMSSGLFPMSDETVGTELLASMGAVMSSVGRRAERLGIRIVIHPDQFVVLSSETPEVVATSRLILGKHALAMDLLGLPRTPWAAMIVHGGKAGRAEQLIAAIRELPEAVRSRLCLENDEYAYSAAEILAICQASGVPMIFDNLHHAIHEKLTDYEDPSFAKCVNQAASTWPKRDWQIVHLSNGKETFLDRYHSEFITAVHSAYSKVRWIEVEARAKECAIAKLADEWPISDRAKTPRNAKSAKKNSSGRPHEWWTPESAA